MAIAAALPGASLIGQSYAAWRGVAGIQQLPPRHSVVACHGQRTPLAITMQTGTESQG